MKIPAVAILVAAVLAALALAGCGAKETVVIKVDTSATPVVPPAAAPAAAPAAPPAAPKGAYPLTTCVVSGEKLGEMGDPVVVTRDGVEIHLCCKNCIKELDADPKKFEAMVTAAKK